MKYIFLVFFAYITLTACDSQQLEEPSPPVYVQNVPVDWAHYQKNKQSAKKDYIKQNWIAYEWFTNFPFSETDGIPYILLKLLPVIAPEYWGSDDNFLDAVGLFDDERQADYPVARGIGISALSRKEPFSNIDYASFTCAACHIGRVRDENDKIRYIDGGVNAEFNIVQFRVRLYKTIQKIYGQEKDPAKQVKNAVAEFSKALEKSHKKNKNFFYKGYKNSWVNLDAEYEKKQIELFKKTADKTIAKFVTRSVKEYTGYAALLNKNYDGFQQASLEGFPGMADATGISTVNGYIAAQDSFLGRLFGSFFLPPKPGITDFMSVWEQGKRKAEWDSEHQTLINGGGQWNGNIPIPMYRNLAAQLTLGLEDNDIRVSAFAVELLDGLPATVYPFDVNTELASKGQQLFKENCAQCHQPHNGKVYTNIGTNLNRSYVVNWLIREAALKGFDAICSPETTVDMAGQMKKPCAKFDGVSLIDKKSLIMSPNNQHHGYNARPLNGIWAQAPYLHNGSVPTVYHLLVPNERPESFIKSRLEYDKEKLGYVWSRSDNNQGYQFDTSAISSFSNAGHEKNIMDGDHTYKLDWSDNIDGAKAIIEYMKTL